MTPSPSPPEAPRPGVHPRCHGGVPGARRLGRLARGLACAACLLPSAIPGAAFDTTGREAAVAAATPAEQPRLRRLYGVTTEALWLDAEGAPGPKAATALQLLESASDAGWIPATTA